MRPISYEELEAEGYLLKEDAKSIETYAEANQIMVTFRSAGAATLDQLKKGAAAKGHDILDKTIKAKSLGLPDNASKNQLNETLSKAMNAQSSSTTFVWDLIGGFVGSWRDKIPTGLYLSKMGWEESLKEAWGNSSCMTIKDSKNVHHKVLKLNGTWDTIQGLANQYKEHFPRLFYTGDYDIHDLARVGNITSSIIPSDSPDEGFIIKTMNEVIYNGLADDSNPQNKIRQDSMKITINKDKRDEQEYQMVRHGAQVSYLAHMIAKEKDEVIIYAVADKTKTPNEMIAGYSKTKGWMLIEPGIELNQWYEDNHVALKLTWKDCNHLNAEIARNIANQVYGGIQNNSRENIFSSDWLNTVIKFKVAAESELKEEILELVLAELTTGCGARLRKNGKNYERMVFAP